MSSFALEGPSPTVTLQARHSKRRREDVLPLKLDTARSLAGFLRGRAPFASAFAIPADFRSAEMIRADLEAAGILYRVSVRPKVLG